MLEEQAKKASDLTQSSNCSFGKHNTHHTTTQYTIHFEYTPFITYLLCL